MQALLHLPMLVLVILVSLIQYEINVFFSLFLFCLFFPIPNIFLFTSTSFPKLHTVF